MLPREEYIEQAYFFRTLAERMREDMPSQEVLASLKEEVLATTNLPLALDYLASELRLAGVFAPAMRQLDHYFTPFQTFVIAEAENERGRFDILTGLEILRREAEYRAGEPSRPGMFFYQFEALCRNRMGYDSGLAAMAEDPIFDEPWQKWILTVRRQIGLVDLADMIYVRSEHYQQERARKHLAADVPPAILFGEKEGRIAKANRQREPLLLLAAMQRQLGYPAVPRLEPADPATEAIPQMIRRFERLEQRIKLVEEEHRGGIDLEKFYERPEGPDSP